MRWIRHYRDLRCQSFGKIFLLIIGMIREAEYIKPEFNSRSASSLKRVPGDIGRLWPTILGDTSNSRAAFSLYFKSSINSRILSAEAAKCVLRKWVLVSFLSLGSIYIKYSKLSVRVSCTMRLNSRPPIVWAVRPWLPETHGLSGKWGSLVTLKGPKPQIFPGFRVWNYSPFQCKNFAYHFLVRWFSRIVMYVFFVHNFYPIFFWEWSEASI